MCILCNEVVGRKRDGLFMFIFHVFALSRSTAHSHMPLPKGKKTRVRRRAWRTGSTLGRSPPPATRSSSHLRTARRIFCCKCSSVEPGLSSGNLRQSISVIVSSNHCRTTDSKDTVYCAWLLPIYQTYYIFQMFLFYWHQGIIIIIIIIWMKYRVVALPLLQSEIGLITDSTLSLQMSHTRLWWQWSHNRELCITPQVKHSFSTDTNFPHRPLLRMHHPKTHVSDVLLLALTIQTHLNEFFIPH